MNSTKTQHFFSTEEKTEKKKKEKGIPFRQRSVGRLSRFAFPSKKLFDAL
jgi:hypothetical protein